MGAENLSCVKSIETHARTFLPLNPIPTSKKSYIKDLPWAESAHAQMKSNLVVSYYIDPFHLLAPIAQLIEHQTCKLEVMSSIPGLAKILLLFFLFMRIPKSDILQKKSNL